MFIPHAASSLSSYGRQSKPRSCGPFMTAWKQGQSQAERKKRAHTSNEETPLASSVDDNVPTAHLQDLKDQATSDIDSTLFTQLHVEDSWELVTLERPYRKSIDQEEGGILKKASRSNEWIQQKQSAVKSSNRPKKRRLRMSAYHVMPVVAACVCDEAEEHVLIAMRPKGKRLAGEWEFPGGKVESMESPEEALVREIKEELNIDLDITKLTPATFFSKLVFSRHLLMVLYVCRGFEGEVKGMENQEFAWASFEDLRQKKYKMTDGDDMFRIWVLEHLDPTSAYAIAKQATSHTQGDGVHAAIGAGI